MSRYFRDFPYLTEEDIRACLAFAAERERKLEVLITRISFLDGNLPPRLKQALNADPETCLVLGPRKKK
jgi:hypothetical protein